MEPRGHGLPLIEGDINRTKLQAILQISLTYCPPTISLSALDSSNPIAVTLTARQEWSTSPTRPLTICTRQTPFDFPIQGRPWTGNSVSKYLLLRSISDPLRILLGDPMATMWIHRAEPDTDDWQTHFGFITIPSQASGQTFQITRQISREDILWRCKSGRVPAPRPGEEFDLKLNLETRHFGIQWFNWGSLEGDLQGKKFVDLADPRLNGKEDLTPPADPYLLSFASWKDQEDDEGNEMVYLEIEQDKTPVRVTLVE